MVLDALSADLTNITDWIFDFYLSLQADLKTEFVVLAAFFLVAVLVALRVHTKNRSKPSETIQALFAVIVSTSVAWPHQYILLVDHYTSAHSKTVTVSMTSFIDAICSGKIEIRNNADLPELLSNKLVVYGWCVTLSPDALWSCVVLRWVLGNHFSFKPALLQNLVKRAHGASIPKESVTPDPISCSLASNAYLDLDYIPFSQLESSLLQLRAGLSLGTSATLKFTTPAAHISFLSPQFTICAVPFLPRKYVSYSDLEFEPRTATPLLASMHRILELLTAGPSALALERVSNESTTYANALKKAARQLEDDRAVRSAFIDQRTMKGWREERLMLAWEAALFSAGHLTRWVVVVRK